MFFFRAETHSVVVATCLADLLRLRELQYKATSNMSYCQKSSDLRRALRLNTIYPFQAVETLQIVSGILVDDLSTNTLLACYHACDASGSNKSIFAKLLVVGEKD